MLRQRPDLCGEPGPGIAVPRLRGALCSGTRTRDVDKPPKWTFNPCHTPKKWRNGRLLGATRGLECCTVQDVALRDLDLAEAEQPHRLDQDRPSGDDRGRAVGVQPG